MKIKLIITLVFSLIFCITQAQERIQLLPEGKWLADDGKIFQGGKTYEINVPVDRVHYFKEMNKSK